MTSRLIEFIRVSNPAGNAQYTLKLWSDKRKDHNILWSFGVP